MSIFHLAIPCVDLNATVDFYGKMFGTEPGRRYSDRQSLNFFGHQLVCYLTPQHQTSAAPLRQPYPRHFGLVLNKRSDIEAAWSKCKTMGATHLSEITWRLSEQPERHLTFWVADPAGQILEFKWFEDPRYVY